MIFVDRTRVAQPDILINPLGKGAKETANAISHYTTPNQTTIFDFKIYRDPEVKNALIDLFRGKCAYCESSFLHVYSGDVEHFRPKGEIEEATPNKKPGYYWLAADWDNLLLSCRNCNQKLKHQIFGEANKKTMGKMNQFPLSAPGVHTRIYNNLNGINDEEQYRLLIHPCIDNPEEHLEYLQEGIIKAKKINGVISPKGAKSIDVFVLQRVPLVQTREKLLIDIEAQIQRVKEATSNYNSHIGDADATKKFYFEKILKRELERLHKFLNPEEQYIGMAKQVIGEFLHSNFNILI